MKDYLIIFSFLIFLISCTEEKKFSDLKSDKSLSINKNTVLNLHDSGDGLNGESKIVSGVNFSYNFISAEDFLSKKGEQIESDDLAQLKNESVFMLEISIQDEMKNIFESPKLKFEKDELIQYLSGSIINDLEIEENNLSNVPTGTLYEGLVGDSGKLRIYFFLNKINPNNHLEIKFYDRIFGTGIVKFTKNSANNLSV